MKQIVNIKKVSVDNELKVSISIEFIANSEDAKKRLFELIEMQGEAVEMSFEPVQIDMY